MAFLVHANRSEGCESETSGKKDEAKHSRQSHAKEAAGLLAAGGRTRPGGAIPFVVGGDFVRRLTPRLAFVCGFCLSQGPTDPPFQG